MPSSIPTVNASSPFQPGYVFEVRFEDDACNGTVLSVVLFNFTEGCFVSNNGSSYQILIDTGIIHCYSSSSSTSSSIVSVVLINLCIAECKNLPSFTFFPSFIFVLLFCRAM